MQTVIIKRYQNRKLYDTNQSCYVTLEEISTQICEGVTIQVIDNKTKKDITTKTLLQAVHDQERQYSHDYNTLVDRLKGFQ